MSAAVRNQAQGESGHNYGGLYLQHTWQVRSNFNLNYGLRYQLETFPSQVLNGPKKEFDPRAGFAYHFGGKYNVVLRGGAGIFHGIFPIPLLPFKPPPSAATTDTSRDAPTENPFYPPP